jgi:hypothetical protein
VGMTLREFRETITAFSMYYGPTTQAEKIGDEIDIILAAENGWERTPKPRIWSNSRMEAYISGFLSGELTE